MATSGGLVEIDDQGQVIRAASSADPRFPDALLMLYSLVVLPEIDRVVVTNSSTHDEDAHGHTYQVWRLNRRCRQAPLDRLERQDASRSCYRYGDEHRLFMLKLDQSTGVLTIDEAFHDSDGRPGFTFDNRDWPHGWKGSATPHGVVFSP